MKTILVPDTLHKRIKLACVADEMSMQAGTASLIERGLEAQLSEVADLVTVIQAYLEAEGWDINPNDPDGELVRCRCENCAKARAALAPFAEVNSE